MTINKDLRTAVCTAVRKFAEGSSIFLNSTDFIIEHRSEVLSAKLGQKFLNQGVVEHIEPIYSEWSGREEYDGNDIILEFWINVKKEDSRLYLAKYSQYNDRAGYIDVYTVR